MECTRVTQTSSAAPSISYTSLSSPDETTRQQAAIGFSQTLQTWGACRIRDHGIPQHIIDDCFNKCPSWFEQSISDKLKDSCNLAAKSHARFVPFGSDKISDDAVLDESLEFQGNAFSSRGHSSDSARALSKPGKELLDASGHMHDECKHIMHTLLDSLTYGTNNSSLACLHKEQNTFFAPYLYYFPEDDAEDRTLRAPPHIDPTTLLLCFQDSHFGLEIADMSTIDSNADLSTAAVKKAVSSLETPYIPVPCRPNEVMVLAGHLLRRIMPGMKHSVHRVRRPLGTSGYHLNFWIVPNLQVDVSGCSASKACCETDVEDERKKEDVAAYLARVSPSSVPFLDQKRLEMACTT
ncbi:uncharacterized protein BDV14DRAFT_177659 [Aspergillus stella-maris]|uniref:uncharacterized protein n=1 Tax=Aspergillus stella-maris TaxID=1810926 RepID=UPI003CCDE52A